MNRTSLLAVGAVALLASASTPAEAYELATNQWPAGTSVVTIWAKQSMQTNFPERFDALVDAAAHISDTAADFTLRVLPDYNAGIRLNNGQSEAWFSRNTTANCGAPACTHSYSSGGVRVESDVVLDPDFGWTYTSSKYDNPEYDPALSSGSTRPALNTAVHELLHAAGLKHEGAYYNVMGNAWNVVNTNGSTTRTYVGEDPTQGLIDLYGPTNSFEDLAVSHFKWAGASGAYSTHERTEMYDLSGSLLPSASISATGDDIVAYRVDEGDTIRVELTLENSGLTDHVIEVTFYLSTNDYISIYDTAIYTRNATINANAPHTATFNVPLPQGVTGERWLGVILDSNAAVAEDDEYNNTAYFAALDIQ